MCALLKRSRRHDYLERTGSRNSGRARRRVSPRSGVTGLSVQYRESAGQTQQERSAAVQVNKSYVSNVKLEWSNKDWWTENMDLKEEAQNAI
jgi:hypothetical protein